MRSVELDSNDSVSIEKRVAPSSEKRVAPSTRSSWVSNHFAKRTMTALARQFLVAEIGDRFEDQLGGIVLGAADIACSNQLSP
jgi:hypothetical protein